MASKWNLPLVECRESRLSGKTIDTEIVMVFQDAGKKVIPVKGPYIDWVERFRKTDAFTAAKGSTQFVRFGGKSGAESVLFVGLGQGSELTEDRIRAAGGVAWCKLVAEKCPTAAVDVGSLLAAKGIKLELTHLKLIRAFAEGMLLAAYRFDTYKTRKPEKEPTTPARLTFLISDKTLKRQLERELDDVVVTAKAVNVTRDWSNEPSNVGTPEYYAAQARKLARDHGVKCRVLTERDAAREKMGLFLAVGKGSAREGRIVILEYVPKGVKKPKTIAFVGKGITFDSGGISIKPSLRMEEMKHDMTGAATIMGATLLAAKLKVPNRIITILGFTENMPGGDAIQPGNVITSRSGKTVEIINTDAEGRLILADLLDYAHEFKPDAIIDAATLTGAVSIALGKHCCGIMGNDDSLIENIRAAGDANGERLWQLPTYDEYFEDMKSDYADMKNSCNDSYGGTIRGAMFLKQYIRSGVKWAHLDIAAVAANIAHIPYFPKRGASGAFVRTLARFAAEF